jgi:hypothetical protein
MVGPFDDDFPDAGDYEDSPDEQWDLYDDEPSMTEQTVPEDTLLNVTPSYQQSPSKKDQPCRAEAMRFAFGPCARGDACQFSHDVKVLDKLRSELRTAMRL